MSDDFRKAKSSLSSSDDQSSKSAPLSAHDAKPIRKVHPLGMRVLVRISPERNMTDSGLYLPEGAKEATQESVIAEVIEVASAIDAHSDEETNVSGVPLGAYVLIPKTVGTRIPWDDQLRIVETRDILALVDEISLI